MSAEQQGILQQLRGRLGDSHVPPTQCELLSLWQQLHAVTSEPMRCAIVHEMHHALLHLPRSSVPQLQAILSSWGEALDDEDVHRYLRLLNEGGPHLGGIHSEPPD